MPWRFSRWQPICSVILSSLNSSDFVKESIHIHFILDKVSVTQIVFIRNPPKVWVQGSRAQTYAGRQELVTCRIISAECFREVHWKLPTIHNAHGSDTFCKNLSHVQFSDIKYCIPSHLILMMLWFTHYTPGIRVALLTATSPSFLTSKQF